MNVSAATLPPATATQIARLYGEPLAEIPSDLYIPPDALEVFLDTFEGPLDLLLYLIRRNNFNVLDIPMARLTEQYLDYVERVRAQRLELAAEYLLMAALLLEIKSRLLLPRPPREVTSDEDPRAALVRRLIEYEAFKRGAARLDELPRAGRDFVWSEAEATRILARLMPHVAGADIAAAWRELVARAEAYRHHRVVQEELSVREGMTHILRRLREGRFVAFVDLFDISHGLTGLVVGFLALLELLREGMIEVTQSEPYAPIYACLRAVNG